MTEKVTNKVKAHIRYTNAAGEVVPGVTTIVGQLAKPQLIIWANRMGLAGIDSTKYRDEKAEVGTLAHAMILAGLRGEKVDTSEYSAKQIEQAENSYLSYLEWAKGKEIKPILVETPLVSESYKYGGTPDCLAYVNGEVTLIDFKTGGVYKEGYIQVCAYRQLIWENNFPEPGRIIILGVPRTEDEAFDEKTYTSFDAGWRAFYHLRGLYDALKDIK